MIPLILIIYAVLFTAITLPNFISRMGFKKEQKNTGSNGNNMERSFKRDKSLWN